MDRAGVPFMFPGTFDQAMACVPHDSVGRLRRSTLHVSGPESPVQMSTYRSAARLLVSGRLARPPKERFAQRIVRNRTVLPRCRRHTGPLGRNRKSSTCATAAGTTQTIRESNTFAISNLTQIARSRIPGNKNARPRYFHANDWFHRRAKRDGQYSRERRFALVNAAEPR